MRLVVIANFDVMGVPASPLKTNAPLFVDSDGVLAFTVSLEGFEVITRRASEILNHIRGFDVTHLPQGYRLNVLREFF